MMTIQQFVEKYDGEHVEVAGSGAANQCVDLANAYIRDCLGLPIIANANAKDFPSRAGDDYTWTDYNGKNAPGVGALVIWGTGVGVNGHIDVCVDERATNESFLGFDQNWPTGAACNVVRHTFNYVEGWLTPKNNTNDMTQEQQQKLDAAYALVEAVKAGCASLRQRSTDGALFADAEVLAKDPDALKRTIWADSQALAIIMRMAGIPQISEEESTKDKYVKVQSARQFDDKK